MREILSMIIVLSLICGASGYALSMLKEITAPAIEEQVLTYVQGPALKRVCPSATNDPIADRKAFTLDGQSIMVFPYKQGDKLLGVALEGKGKGFGGDIGVMVGFNLDNDSLIGIGVTEMRETPGLGTKVAEPKFAGQFTGKPMNVELTAKGGTIDAISGATISSAGTVLAVQSASKDFQALKAEIQKTWQ